MKERTKQFLWATAIIAAVVAVLGTLATLFVREQIGLQRRNLFSSLALKRIAALEHISREQPSVDHVNLLRDYLAWEPRRLLRNKARAIIERMEGAALDRDGSLGGPAA
ncbi:MAG: hypothetical protein EXR92_03605 [Gemmatimonadetes bacterium]|nr:hypothetical protein [Gemmatimonadota bacterium]